MTPSAATPRRRTALSQRMQTATNALPVFRPQGQRRQWQRQ
jgi:hypothetical protein